MSVNNPSYTCRELLAHFVNKEFDKWAGIPADCQTNNIFSLFKPISEDTAVGKLGSEYVQTFYKTCLVENYDEPVEVWFKEDAIIKMETKYPKLSAEAMIKVLGEPAGRLDYYLGMVLMPRLEWVYPDRGISFFFNAEKTAVVKLSVYHPASLEDYQRKIRPPFSTPREFPDRK